MLNVEKSTAQRAKTIGFNIKEEEEETSLIPVMLAS